MYAGTSVTKKAGRQPEEEDQYRDREERDRPIQQDPRGIGPPPGQRGRDHEHGKRLPGSAPVGCDLFEDASFETEHRHATSED